MATRNGIKMNTPTTPIRPDRTPVRPPMIIVFRAGFGHTDFLVPAMLTAYGIGLHRESQVLVHAAVFPEDSFGVRVVAFEWFNSMYLPHQPLARLDLFEIDQCGRPALAAAIFGQTPAPEMVRAGDHAGLDAFGRPDLVDEITDLGVDFEEIAGLHVETLGVLGVKPERIAVGNLVEPFGIARPRVNQRRQTEGR